MRHERLPGVDYSCASEQPDDTPGSGSSARNESAASRIDDGGNSNGSDVNLYAFTRCPKCGRVLYVKQERACPDCGTEIFDRED